MKQNHDDAKAVERLQIAQWVAENLGINAEELFANKTFRKEIGAEELDQFELLLEKSKSPS